MNQEVEQFLASDLLENYLLGVTTFEDTQKAEHFISTYPEVKAQYIRLQENLESYSRSFVAKAPEELKEEVMRALTVKKQPKYNSRYFAIASILVICIVLSTFYFWNQNNILVKKNRTLTLQNKTLLEQNETLAIQNTEINHTITLLEEDINTTKSRFATIQDQFTLIKSPRTQKYMITGNKKAEQLKALAYVNPDKKTSYINIIHLPKLSEDRCYQMWADVNGEMISVAILENTKGELIPIPYKENAIGYNITIEPKGGNDHATVENLVANILL